MERNVTSHLELLKVLHKADPKTSKSILKLCNCDLVRCLVECAHNCLIGNLPLTTSEKRKLKKHRLFLHRLAKKGESVEKKRKLMIQKGSGIGAVAALAGPIISAIVSHFISK